MLRDNSNATITGQVAAIVDGDTFILRDAKGEHIDVLKPVQAVEAGQGRQQQPSGQVAGAAQDDQ